LLHELRQFGVLLREWRHEVAVLGREPPLAEHVAPVDVQHQRLWRIDEDETPL